MQMFRLFSDCHIGVPRTYTNMASHTDLCEVLRSLGKRTGLKLWELSRLFTFYNMTISRLFPLDGFRLIYLWRHSENDLLWYLQNETVTCICTCLPCAAVKNGEIILFRQNDVWDWTKLLYVRIWLIIPPPPTSWLRWFDIICTGPYPAFSIGVLPIFPSSDWCENYTSFCKESKFG